MKQFRLSFFAAILGCTMAGVAAPGDLIVKVTNPDPAAMDQFGAEMAASKTDLVIGAPNNSPTVEQPGRGTVYLYTMKTPTLRDSINGTSNDAFTSYGSALAIGGKNVVIGQPAFDASFLLDSGYAYLASLKTGNYVRSFSNPAITAQDYFGSDVAARKSLFAIGASGDDTVKPNAGTVYLYDIPTSVPVRILYPASQSTNQEFGRALAFVNNTIAVGAPGQVFTSMSQAGIVHLYDSRTAFYFGTLTPPIRSAGARFGDALAGSKRQLAVGAPGEVTSGAVYLYSLSNNAPPIVIANPTPANGDAFGASVAFVGTKYLLVGAPGDDTGGTDAGSAYVYDAKTGALLLTVPNPEAAAGDRFGAVVASDGKSLVIGSPGDVVAALPGAGSVFVIEGP